MKYEDLPVLTGNAIRFSKVQPDPALPGNIVPCLMCGKPFLMPHFIGTPDQLCGECLKTYADTAKVICSKCKVVICRLVPKLLSSGFYIRPHGILHVDACGICRPGLRESVIREIEEWERLRGRGRIILSPR